MDMTFLELELLKSVIMHTTYSAMLTFHAQTDERNNYVNMPKLPTATT